MLDTSSSRMIRIYCNISVRLTGHLLVMPIINRTDYVLLKVLQN